MTAESGDNDARRKQQRSVHDCILVEEYASMVFNRKPNHIMEPAMGERESRDTSLWMSIVQKRYVRPVLRYDWWLSLLLLFGGGGGVTCRCPEPCQSDPEREPRRPSTTLRQPSLRSRKRRPWAKASTSSPPSSPPRPTATRRAASRTPRRGRQPAVRGCARGCMWVFELAMM